MDSLKPNFSRHSTTSNYHTALGTPLHPEQSNPMEDAQKHSRRLSKSYASDSSEDDREQITNGALSGRPGSRRSLHFDTKPRGQTPSPVATNTVNGKEESDIKMPSPILDNASEGSHSRHNATKSKEPRYMRGYHGGLPAKEESGYEADVPMTPRPQESEKPAPTFGQQAASKLRKSFSLKSTGGKSTKSNPMSTLPPTSPTSVGGETAPSTIGRSRSVKSAVTGTTMMTTGTGVFARGAAVSGPPRALDEYADLNDRAIAAEEVLDPSTKAKISKIENKDARRISRIMKNEGRVEERMLNIAIGELETLQKVQKIAANDEAAALKAYSKAAKEESKASRAYLAAKARYDSAAGVLQAANDRLEGSRQYSETQSRLLHEKAAEVEQLRQQKATDDRERHVKLATIAQPVKHVKAKTPSPTVH